MEAADHELFERSLAHAVTSHRGTALDAALSELGWLDLLEIDGRAAVSTLFTLLGSMLGTCAALEVVLATSLGLPTSPPISLVLPALLHSHPPGLFDGDVDRDGDSAGARGRLAVAGLLHGTAVGEGDVMVVAGTDDADRLVAVVAPRAELTVRPVGGMDPDLALLEVTGDLAPADEGWDLAPAAWTTALARCRLALAHELLGASRAMLELARQHALDRTQFGQAIGKFQAVRHRLADALVAIESAEAMLDAAWEDGTPSTAAMAKALAGRAARTTARHCQQVLAGIGFTTEHDFHRYFRRVLILDALLGGSRPLTRELGMELLETRRLPTLVPLSP